MKFLLTGKGGQVGFELLRSIAPLGQIVAVDRRECDLADESVIRSLVRRVEPDVIINAGAYTAVDKAESDGDAVFAINGMAPGVLGQEAARYNALVIHYSTDYVFDGTKAVPYDESDTPNPINVYGKSKWEGEQALAACHPNHLILRTSWVVGAYGANFAKTMLRLAEEREQLSVVSDQVGAPTSAALLADLTALMVHQYMMAGPEGFPFGTYHVAASGETHWCDYAKFVIAEALAAGRSLKVTPEKILPIASADYKTPARRPANSRLDTNRFRRTFGLQLPHWQQGVRHILRQILQ